MSKMVNQNQVNFQLTARQSKLFEYIKSKHGDQKRKYSGAPYWTHLWAVAEIVSVYGNDQMEVEVALCHDLIEDTDATYADLEDQLNALQYTEVELNYILKGVEDLTDVFVSSDYPTLNRRKRKELEAERLLGISGHSQTVKYADIIDNTASILAEDPGFSRVYMGEITRYILKLNQGNPELYQRCLRSLGLRSL